ncbi:acetyl-CoA synthetase-like protein [Xylaria cf. heliscus]|nr:acetyl-CoA synthetase-like protein [Xylaria cf. heliscus]
MSASHTNRYSTVQDTILSEISIALGTPVSCLDLVSSFIQNGGDSVSSVQLQIALRKHGIRISIHNVFTATSLLCLIKEGSFKPLYDLEDVQPQSYVLDRKRKYSETGIILPERLNKTTSWHQGSREKESNKRYPLTEMQMSLLQSTHLNHGYNVISYFETHRPENIPALRLAWETVLRLEEIFNISFQVTDSGDYLCERGRIRFIWEEVIVHDEPSYQEQLENQAPPDEPIGSSFKIITFQPLGAEGKSTVIWRVHHAMIDGVSCSIVLSKVRQALNGTPVQAGPSFGTFSLKLQALQSQGRECAVEFWARQKRDHPSPSAQLPFGVPSSNRGNSLREIDQVYVSSDISALKEISKAAGVTLASLYYATWGLVLSRYTSSNSVVCGAILSGRNLLIEGVQSVIGPLINVLPLYISLNSQWTVREYLQHTFASLLELTSLHWTTPSHGFTRNFSTAISVRFDVPEPIGGPFTLLEHPRSRVCSDVPLSIEVGHCGLICLTYHTKSFSRLNIERLGDAFSSAFDSLSDLDSKITSCLNSLICESQRMGLARIGNWTAKSTRQGTVEDDLVSLFLQAVERNPSLPAVEHNSCSLTYTQLHEQSSLVAQRLSKLVLPGDIVCVHADGSINWIVAIYAILKTGAVYCPLSPTLPDAARDINFTATNAKLYLTGNDTAKSTRPISCEVCLSVEGILREEGGQLENTPRTPRPTANAYLCFTSGSTGKPKGVLCRHESLVAFQSDFQVRLCARPGWRIAQFMSPEFDGSIHEIFSALCYGGTLVLKEGSRPFDHLKRCDAAILTPSVAKALDPAEFLNLKTVYFVGEAVQQSVCDLWAGQRELFNMYGPTEGTCGATIGLLTQNKPVTLGIPNPSTRVYILDSQKRLAPFGVVGEIYLAGIQVATGYIGQPTETSMRFLLDCVNPQYCKEYMYKTGDRAYWNEHGELMFLGRQDRQLKLRGFRVDLDDLEVRMLKAYDKCTAAAVTVKDDHLVALVQPANLDLDEFRLHIRNHIPPYALPRYITAVKSLPTTPVGKLDYKAIAAVATSSRAQGVPLTVSREMVISVLKEVLGMCIDESIDLDITFTDLGVNSLLAIHLSQRLSRAFRLRIPISMVLGMTTVREFVGALSCLQTPELRQIDSTLGNHRISPIEAEWWHKYHQHPNTSSFNVTYACRLPITMEKSKFISAWNTILCRHQILRCRYMYSNLHGLRREYGSLPPTVKLTKAIDIHHEINIPFDIEKDDLVRVLISPTQLLVVISHIICDLTTLRILLQEVADTYHGRCFAPVMKAYSQTTWSMPASPRHLSFWSDYLAGTPDTNYAVGSISTRRKGWTGSSYMYQIPENTHQAMNDFTTMKRVTMHQLSLASVALALQNKNDHCDITIGAPYLNRHSEEDLEVVGLFLEPLPIRIRYDPTLQGTSAKNNTIDILSACEQDSFIKIVQKSSEGALSHAIPWDQLLSHLNLTPNFPNHPIFDVMVTFHEASQEVQLPLPGIRFLPTWSKGAKFKLMAEFTARKDGDLSLRLEYSDECFTAEDIRMVARLVCEALDGLVADDDYSTISRRLELITSC